MGMPSTHTSHLVVWEVGFIRSLVGPSDNYIAKQVVCTEKVLGVCFKVEDTLEESRLGLAYGLL